MNIVFWKEPPYKKNNSAAFAELQWARIAGKHVLNLKSESSCRKLYEMVFEIGNMYKENFLNPDSYPFKLIL